MIPFVDAHFHLWDLDRLRYAWLTPPYDDTGPNGSVEAIASTYLAERYRIDLGPWNLVGAVHVEAGAAPDDALAETGFIEEQAELSGLQVAIVAHADLTNPGVSQLLADHARHPRVRGIRQIVNWHPEPRRTYSPYDVTLDPQWERGFAALAVHGLSFDLQCYPAQMPHLARILGRHPAVPVMINHMGMPVLGDPNGLEQWREGMGLLAELPHVSVKLSGPGFIDRKWTRDSIEPLILEAIDLFGTDRAMFATDIPTDKLFGSVDGHLCTYTKIVSRFEEDEQRALFGGNANRLYRLGLAL